MLFTIRHKRFSRVEIPLPPRRDHLNTGLQRISPQLKPDLIIAFTGSTVRNRISAGLGSYLDQSLRNQRPCNRGAEQVFAFIYRVGSKHGKYEIFDEALLQVFDINLVDTQGLCLRASWLDLLRLPNVSREGHDFTLIGFLEPSHDDGGV